MTELQEKLTNMLGWFHDFCVENGLVYYAAYGTAIGIIRHKGFIPWDDDIDVTMPRDDYNKLIKLANSVEMQGYLLNIPLETEGYAYTYAKLVDPSTTVVENIRYKMKTGISIDIFPLDGAGNSLEQSLDRCRKIVKMNKFIAAKTCAILPRRKIHKNIAIICARIIPEFIYSWRRIIRNLIDESSELSCNNCKYVVDYTDFANKPIEKAYFGAPKLYDFENIKIYGPSNADAYLKEIYGDYMELPPLEKRVSLHDKLYMDLKRGFRE